MIQRQIQATDGQINRLVYELYGLNEEEIKIVEGGWDYRKKRWKIIWLPEKSWGLGHGRGNEDRKGP